MTVDLTDDPIALLVVASQAALFVAKKTIDPVAVGLPGAVPIGGGLSHSGIDQDTSNAKNLGSFQSHRTLRRDAGLGSSNVELAGWDGGFDGQR